MTANQDQFITCIMRADNTTIVNMCKVIYQQKYNQVTNKYSDLSFNDETVLEEFRFRNAIPFEQTVIPEKYPRITATETQMMYDFEKFVDIRDRMNLLIGELQSLEDSTEDWFPDITFHVKTLRNFLEMWTDHSQELSMDCQSLVREFKAKL